ncbi:MAG: response regulator transcription factor [Planctomycetia bacterium]|nr:response regulator transcription factor [Planctomycetia bacterium]
MVDETLRGVGSIPVLVIDECFDDEFSRLLLEGGVLDYLDAVNLSCAKLQRRIEWAILRNGHRATAPTLSVNHDTAAGGHNAPECREILNRLAPRGRQVLDLLATGLTPKQIASKLGTKPKTVWNQLANLRLRFGVNSNHALGLLVIQFGQKENDGE